VCVTLLLSVISGCAAHGAIVSPRSRNSIDYLAGVRGIDRCYNFSGPACENGQAAHYYSQGCTIGCPTCDHVSGRQQVDLCGLGKSATLPDYARSVNRQAAAGSDLDIYKHNPWRAPGSAPVADACGLAGGTPWGADAPEEGRYVNTSFAHHGMRGTALRELATGVRWAIGGAAEVTWQVRNNHGGGYSYRLCPAGEPLTEACFQRHPLPFERTKQALVVASGQKVPIRGLFVDEGTSPPGSTWARLPLPADILGPRCACSPGLDYKPRDFACGCLAGEEKIGCTSAGNCSLGACAPCPGSKGSDCSRCGNGLGPAFEPPFHYSGQPAVYDVVRVPAGLRPGRYVLGFRYDCEATAQVWSSCSDITLVEEGGAPEAS